MSSWFGGLAATVLTLTVLPVSAVRADTSEPPPPLEIPAARLAEALHCGTESGELRGASDKPTVLFVPGTGLKGEENYAWNYMAELKKKGYQSCWVDSPGRGLRDMQESVEYVVYATRAIHEATGRKVDLVGHSQGGLLTAWALRFWPDLPGRVEDMVTLGSPFQGTRLASPCRPIAEVAGCPASVLQFARDSNWTKALGADGTPMPTGPSYTTVHSYADESVVADGQAPSLPGAHRIGVQDICPGRPWPTHIAMVVDQVSYDLVADAVDHPGPADADRIDRAHCAKAVMPLNSEEAVNALPGLLNYPIELLIHSQPWLKEEPMLREYAR
ncbi:alpha/beta fold hydrolase [Streptomyces sp. SID10115]|uniref:esterase/lipase family protein n=1 Tax=Streptomyces sp. SID10115 TaxID=2706016 RepID=UPI0013CCB96A|nr:MULTISPECIES: alpha/beta fold hydrolase [unclassified Streptomyces]NDZ85526.1 alpha/beta fold hydrolase [Streptomyces sp. SID10115]